MALKKRVGSLEQPSGGWVEKYRPRAVSDVEHQVQVVARLQSAVKESVSRGDLPHLLFYGPSGTGKTTTALALCRELFPGRQLQSCVTEVNVCEKGDSIFEHINQFALTALPSSPQTIKNVGPSFKVMILDNVDTLMVDAQKTLRETIQLHSKSIRFIIICRYISRIIDQVTSCCARFRFNPLPFSFMFTCLRTIVKSENFLVDDNTLSNLIQTSAGDLEYAINTLESAKRTLSFSSVCSYIDSSRNTSNNNIDETTKSTMSSANEPTPTATPPDEDADMQAIRDESRELMRAFQTELSSLAIRIAPGICVDATTEPVNLDMPMITVTGCVPKRSRTSDVMASADSTPCAGGEIRSFDTIFVPPAGDPPLTIQPLSTANNSHASAPSPRVNRSHCRSSLCTVVPPPTTTMLQTIPAVPSPETVTPQTTLFVPSSVTATPQTTLKQEPQSIVVQYKQTACQPEAPAQESVLLHVPQFQHCVKPTAIPCNQNFIQPTPMETTAPIPATTVQLKQQQQPVVTYHHEQVLAEPSSIKFTHAVSTPGTVLAKPEPVIAAIENVVNDAEPHPVESDRELQATTFEQLEEAQALAEQCAQSFSKFTEAEAQDIPASCTAQDVANAMDLENDDSCDKDLFTFSPQVEVHERNAADVVQPHQPHQSQPTQQTQQPQAEEGANPSQTQAQGVDNALDPNVHVTIWNKLEKRKIAGNASPFRRNLERYLAAHPDCEEYCGQDKLPNAKKRKPRKRGSAMKIEEMEPGEHVVMWNTRQKRKIAGNASPLVKNLGDYRRKNPHIEVYVGQDKEGYVPPSQTPGDPPNNETSPQCDVASDNAQVEDHVVVQEDQHMTQAGEEENIFNSNGQVEEQQPYVSQDHDMAQLCVGGENEICNSLHVENKQYVDPNEVHSAGVDEERYVDQDYQVTQACDDEKRTDHNSLVEADAELSGQGDENGGVEQSSNHTEQEEQPTEGCAVEFTGCDPMDTGNQEFKFHPPPDEGG